MAQIQMIPILATSRTWVRATKPISGVEVSRHLHVPQVWCHHTVHYICLGNMFGRHDKIDERDVKHRKPSVRIMNICRGDLGLYNCFSVCQYQVRMTSGLVHMLGI